MSDLTNPIFTNEDKAREHLEAIRWPDGPVCPSCGFGNTVKPLGGKSMGPGWYHCGSCREKFTVRVGTVYERSKIPLHKWLLATHLICASKKGMSAHQLHRMLGTVFVKLCATIIPAPWAAPVNLWKPMKPTSVSATRSAP